MIPPPDAVKELLDLHPTARWGYCGTTNETGEPEFALLEIYPRHEAKNKMYEPWDGRGPVFGPAFDPETHEALWLWTFTRHDLQTKAFVPLVKRWRTPLRQRMIESAKERGKQWDATIDGLAEEMGCDMYRRAQRSNHHGEVVAKKFLTTEERAVIAGDTIRDLSDDFMPFQPGQ
jgi:hypothetical protein